jgi:hypothetical protein
MQSRRTRTNLVTVAFPAPAQQLRVDWGALVDNPMLPVLVATLVLCPAGFLTLPVSRRRAKVRYAHIHRVTLYSVTLLVLPIGGLLGGPMLHLLARRLSIAYVLWVASFVVVIAYPVLLTIFWSCATGRYLKMGHAWGVGLAVVLMASLSTTLAAVLIHLALT